MKKQNKNYLSLAEQGITKAWDKAVIFKERETEHLQMVVYYQNKPIYDWPVKDAFNVESLKFSLFAMLSTYSEYNLNHRKVCKRLTKYHVANAGEKVVTYRRGGVLFPSTGV